MMHSTREPAKHHSYHRGTYGRFPRKNLNFPNFPSTHKYLCVDANYIELDLSPRSTDSHHDIYVREIITTKRLFNIVIVF